MKKHRFKIFYSIYGGEIQTNTVEEYTPDKAGIFLRRVHAGKQIIIKKIKKLDNDVEPST
jgi:hypothetical protein